MYTFVPQSSSILINCTAARSQNPLWSIRLPNLTQFSDYFSGREELYHRNGLYPQDSKDIDSQLIRLSLLINSTQDKNRTTVRCIDATLECPACVIFETTLMVYGRYQTEWYDLFKWHWLGIYLVLLAEPNQISYLSQDIRSRSVNISWSPLPLLGGNQTYTLTVENRNTPSLTFQYHEPYTVFSAPEDAPPCEVYNFSVTATYVGATYTGAGCSVPSPVLSRMLPSLPDITGLKNSCINLLMKQPGGGVTLNVTFQVHVWALIMKFKLCPSRINVASQLLQRLSCYQLCAEGRRSNI